MSKTIKIFTFLIIVLLIFNKQIISQTLLYAFSKWVDREVLVDKFEINYSKNLVIINGVKIINPEEFYYDNFIESEKVTLRYNFKSLLSNLIIIDNFTVENPKFFLEIIKKLSSELSPNKKQEMYEDNIGAVKKIIKSVPRKIWPPKKKDTNFLILEIKMNGAKAFIKTPLLSKSTNINLSDIHFFRVGNGGENYLHHKIALKEIASEVIEKIPDLKVKKELKKIYNYKNLYTY